jgi:urease accessory protein
MTLRATSFRRAASLGDTPFDIVVLDAEERHLRRKLITLQHGDEVLVDFERAVKLEHGDCLVLDDGRVAEVIAAEEDLLEVRGRDTEHMIQLAWHIGNRHLAAQIEKERILIRRDKVIRSMLEGLGASTRDVSELFEPEHGAYHSHGH